MKCMLVVLMLISAVSLDARSVSICVEGNIGAGKSTFLEIMQKNIPAVFSLEPCDQWQDVAGHNLLQSFYEDVTTWAPLFQLYVCVTRARKQQKDQLLADKLHVLERSLFSDRYCFAQKLYDDGLFCPQAFAVYQDCWNWFFKLSQKPVGLIYLRVAPEVCLKRLKARNRKEEVGVPLAYLQGLHAYHEQLLIDKTTAEIMQEIPVLVLDGNLDFKTDELVQQTFIRQILDFLKINGNIDLII